VPRHRHHFERGTLVRLAAGARLAPVETSTPFSLDLGAFGLFQSLAAGAGLGAFLFTDVARPHRPGWWRRPRGLLHLALAPLLAGLAIVAVAVEAVAAAAGRGGVLRIVFEPAGETD
jgi:hypothetical protein